jgi:hypothetical protein
MDYSEYLTALIQCQAQQDPTIKHEWLFNSKADAVRVANYLRNSGYCAELHEKTIPFRSLYYVGVPFHTLKIEK